MQALVSFNLNTVLVALNLIQYFNCVMTRHLETEINKTQMTIGENKNMTIIPDQVNITAYTTPREGSETTAKLRTKRQSGGGKYADAAQMSQAKILRLWLQMFANVWSNVYVGGTHPFHRDIPKPVVIMMKRRIGEFLFPKLEADEEKDK